MKRATQDAARALFRADETIDRKLIDPAFDVLRGKTAAGIIVGYSPDRVYSRRQAAEVIGRSVKTIDLLARLGKLKRVKGSGGRSIGVLASSVMKYLGARLVK